MIFAMTDRGHPVRLPEGSSLDLDMIRDVAMVSNWAHRTLGTRLLGLEANGAVLGIDLVGTASSDATEWPNGVVTSLIDHACAIAALMTLDDRARFGGSVGLRVEYIRPSRAHMPLHVRAECHHCTASVALVHAEVFHPDEPAIVVAVGRGTIAVNGVSIGNA
jgi:hypothetical protein